MNTEGAASYHLGTDSHNYIKYENVPWTLTDGSHPPRKKYFLNDHFDFYGKTFTGEIDWSGNLFNGAKRWVYEMIFAEDLQSIKSGTVTVYGPIGMQEVHKFGEALNYTLLRSYDGLDDDAPQADDL
jgi:hypothetical protein